jgi:hypothetical protein
MTGEQRNQLPYRIALTAVEEENETRSAAQDDADEPSLVGF